MSFILSSSSLVCRRESLFVLVFKIWFWWSNFHLFFIARGWLHGLLILFCLFLPLCSLVSLHLSSLITSLVALSFALFATPGLKSIFSTYVLCAWKVVYGLKLKLLFFGGWLPFSPTQVVYLSIQSFVVFRWHGRLVCACLVCEVLFLSLSWWLCFRCFRLASFCFVVTLFLRWLFFLWPTFLVFFCAGAWSRSFVFRRLISHILCFYFFSDICLFYPRHYIIW